MSKDKTVVSSKESGAHSFKDKGHLKREKYEGAHDTGKHEAPKKEQGSFYVGKPIIHVEDATHHSGRVHPPATKLSDSKILKGKLRKEDA